MSFSMQGHLSGYPFPTPGDLPDPGIEPASLASPALAGGLLTIAPPGKPPFKSRQEFKLKSLLLVV